MSAAPIGRPGLLLYQALGLHDDRRDGDHDRHDEGSESETPAEIGLRAHANDLLPSPG
ncbi:MAG TPA: hypothetical protein VIG08_16875 [Gemmatimonadales bacterium]